MPGYCEKNPDFARIFRANKPGFCPDFNLNLKKLDKFLLILTSQSSGSLNFGIFCSFSHFIFKKFPILSYIPIEEPKKNFKQFLSLFFVGKFWISPGFRPDFRMKIVSFIARISPGFEAKSPGFARPGSPRKNIWDAYTRGLNLHILSIYDRNMVI